LRIQIFIFRISQMWSNSYRSSN